jgi:hypothetical protein
MSPGAIAGITIAVLIAVACAAAVAIYAFRRRVQANSAAIHGIGMVEVQVSPELELGTMPASANGTSSQARGDDTVVTISAANAQQDVTAPPLASTARSDSQPDVEPLLSHSPSASAAAATAGPSSAPAPPAGFEPS